MTKPQTAGQWLKAQREARGLTPEQLAQEMGKSAWTINRNERLERFSPIVAKRLAAYFGEVPEDLITAPPDDGAAGQWLEDQRKALDLSKKDLAQRIGCTPQAVQAMSRLSLMRHDVAAKVSAALGVQVPNHLIRK